MAGLKWCSCRLTSPMALVHYCRPLNIACLNILLYSYINGIIYSMIKFSNAVLCYFPKINNISNCIILMDRRGYASSARYVILWTASEDIFKLTEKLIILKHCYARKRISGVFRLNIYRPIRMMEDSGKTETKKTCRK